MEKQNHFNSLLRRRQKLQQLVNKITQSNDDEKIEAMPSKAKSTPSPKTRRSDSTVSSEFSMSIIEDSDNDSEKIGASLLSARERKLYVSQKTESSKFYSSNQSPDKENIVAYSSSDTSDMINTSTISFEINHSFFINSSDTSKNLQVFGVDLNERNINQKQISEPPTKRAKISIISDEIVDNDVYLSKCTIRPTTSEYQYEPEKEATYFNLCNAKDVNTTVNILNNTSSSLVKNGITCLRNVANVSEPDTVAKLDVTNPPETGTIDISSPNLPKHCNSDVSGTKMEYNSIPGLSSDICTDADLQDPALRTYSEAANTVTENVGSDDSSHKKTESWNQPGTSQDFTMRESISRLPDFDSSPDKNKTNSKVLEKCQVQKRGKQKFKRTHIDFMSDDEFYSNFPDNEDYSPGSSEVWSVKDSEQSNTSDGTLIEKKKPKKKITKKKEKIIECKEGNKIKYKKENRVNKRKSLKTKREKGESYETSTGKVKEAKKLQPNPCHPGKCPRECYQLLDERRQKIFDYFWNLDIQRKRDWLVCCASRVPIKRKKTDLTVSKRTCTFEYYINEGEGRRQICQQFLLKTLDITQNFLLYTLNNAHAEGLSQEERRRPPNNAKKYDETIVNEAKEYIESLPLVSSHYCRKSSDRYYLPQEYKTLTNLYRLYRKSCDQRKTQCLSERIFINLFRTEYNNVSIHVPKKDKCNICANNENNPNEAQINKEKIKVHLEEKAATYERFISHQNYSGNKDTIVASFDLQKVLNTPHGDNMLLFYSRKYTFFNLSVYESSTQNGFCYVWGECDGKRGAKEIGSCLFKYLNNIDERGIKKLILYCDASTAQNRNRTILSILQYYLSISKNVETIQINYLLTGHSYMPVDSMHSVIEREVRKLTVWSYTQWPSYMESARKNPRPYIVTVMEHTDFIDWDPLTEKMFPQEKMKDLQVTKIRIATMKKKYPTTIETKHSMKEGATVHVIKINETLTAETKETNQENNTRSRKVKGKGKGKGKGKNKGKSDMSNSFLSPPEDLPDIKPLYKTRLPISLAKYKDLKKLCENVMPSRFHKDYLELPYCSKVKDTLNQTDEEDNIEEISHAQNAE